ncbi:DedA family protein [Phytoactinopolyspora halotolerans]|uniref:DedA family protein n=1 Tax=Phytoactinopolyspora halotolerans TaxID=1981512 RepID=A0A6L9S0S2_9ACTN|nr:VTT domain-containing protein [Phytoactinopolyspora halotolerans]NED99074.1 DedA family protein [Phytoactinopolyspora halotolerans]
MDLLALAAVPALAYMLIAALVAADAIVPVVPSEVAVVTAGTLAAAGRLDAVSVLVAAAAGAVAGDSIVYLIGRHALPGRLARSRLGRRMQHSVERAYARMGSASVAAIIAGRFVPLGRTASSAAAGLAGVAPQRFLLWGAIGGSAWASWMLGIGYVTGSVTEAPLWAQSAIGAATAIVIGVWFAAGQAVVRTRRRMSARAAAAGRTIDTSSVPPNADGEQARPSMTFDRIAA